SLGDASRRPLVAAVLVAVILTSIAGVWILAGAKPLALNGDNLSLTYPLLADAWRQVRSGHLPLWTAGRWGGSPLLGDPVVGALYPPFHLAYALTPWPHVGALDLAVVIHLAWLVLGNLWLLHTLGARPIVALTGTILLALNAAILFMGKSWIQYW